MATEERLIDAIAYCKVLREEMDYLLELDKTKGYQTLKERMGLEVAIADLGDMPTVDAVKVVHGWWKYGTRAAVCSECQFERNLDDNFGSAIACPNCGAKMDGDGNG